MTLSEKEPQTQEAQRQQFKSPKLYRLRQIWREYQWQLSLILLAFSLILGYIGFSKYTRAIGEQLSPTDLLYLTLQLATLESGAVSGPVSWELEIARLLVPLTTAFTAILGIAVLFRKQLQMLRLWYIRDHIVICGLGDKGALLAVQLHQQGANVVIIEKDMTNSKIDLFRENGVIVLEGDATEMPILNKAAIRRAKFLIAVCGDDGINTEIAMSARQLSKNRKQGVLDCSIHIHNPQLYELLRQEILGGEKFPKFRLEIFNSFDLGARELLRNYIDLGRMDKLGNGSVHILIVGLGRLGETLVIQSARSWYEKARPENSRLKISIVDRAADNKVHKLCQTFPQLANCCQLIPYPFGVDDPQFQEAEFLFDQQGTCDLISIFVLLEDQTEALESALKLRLLLNCDQPPIVVLMEEDSGLATLLNSQGDTAKSFHNVIPFGLLQRTCTPELVLGGSQEVLARLVHEDYLNHRLKEGIQMGSTRSTVPWEELPLDLRESNRRQVDHVRLKLHTAGYGIKPLSDWEAANFQFSSDEIELMAKVEHQHWLEERERNGWRYAPDENLSRKTHPDILPWDQLPEQAKEKDRQPVKMLPALLAKGGFQIYRLNQEKSNRRSKADGA